MVLFLSALVFLSCASVPYSLSPDDTVERWAASLEGKDIDTLMTTYWPDAALVIPGDDGSEESWNGSDEIRELQNGSAGNPDVEMVVKLNSSQRKMNENSAIYTIDVESGGMVIVNTLELEKRDNEWRIMYQTLTFQ